MNNIINSRCVCDIGLSWINIPQIMIFPCEHILHKKCHKLTSNKCDICNEPITDIKDFNQIRKLSKKGGIYYQRYIDMIATSNFNHMSTVDEYDLKHLSDIMGFIPTLPFKIGYDECQSACHEIMRILNAKQIISGFENINNNPKVYISTHTTYLDFIVINSFLKCGYVTSSYIKKTFFGKMIMNIVPLLLIDRNKKGMSTVEQMKKYIKKHGSICLFPEGTITHPDVIQKFRTGAFHTGYPVQPIVIKYEPVVYDSDMSVFIKKLFSIRNIKINIIVLPTEYPPFDDIKIEEIRTKMAQAGNIALSRVSNRDTPEPKA